MRCYRLWVVWVTFVAATVLAGRPAHGQESCYQGFGPSMVNICPTASQDIDYRVNGTYGVAGVTVNGKSYAFDIHGNGLDVFDFTNPTAPTRLTSTTVNIPWWPPPDGGSDPSLINRLRGLATLDGFPYALGSFYTDGWDFFKLGTNTFLRKGYRPTLKTRYLNSALFWDSTRSKAYAVGQLLDATAIAANDVGAYAYLVWNGSTITPETINYTSMADNRYRVPIGGSGDGAYAGFALGAGSATFYPFVFGGQLWFLVTSTNGQAVAVELKSILGTVVPTPTGPIWTSATDPNLFSGPWAVDREHAILHVASKDFTTVYSYDISNAAAGPVPIAATPWHDAMSSPNCVVPVISAGGGVIAVGCGAYAGYVPADQNGVPAPPALPADTGTTQATFVNPDQCNPNLNLRPYVRGLSVFVTPSQQTCVARAIYSWGDVIALNDSCLSTVPVPRLTVARNANQGTLDTTCTNGDARGYPGDTFTITNTSGGAWSNPKLTITPPSGTPQVINPLPTPYTWTSPTNGPTGQWGFDLDVTDDAGLHYLASAQTPPGNKTINLCGSPGAGITKTPTTYLTGDTVTLSAAPPASQGNPSGYNWLIDPPSGTNITATGASYALVLAQQGAYAAYVRVHYAHAANSDPTCSQSPFNVMPAGSHYDSCTSITLDSQPFSVGALTLAQTPPPSGGNYLLGQPITLSVPYKLGAGYTATFAWALDGPANVIAAFNPNPSTDTASGSSKSATVTGTIPANYFTAAGTHTVYLVSSATNGGPAVVPTPQPQATFNVVNCQPAGAPTSLRASVSGQAPNATVTLSWSGSGTAPVNYHAYTTPIALFSCNSVDTTSCAITVSSAGTYHFKVSASNACSGTLTSTETGSFTVTGGTPPPTPTPTPNPTETANFTFSPTNPEVEKPVNFYGTASGGTPTAWAWTFGDGFGPIGGGGGSSTLQNPTYSYSSDGPFTVTLKVTFASGNQKSVSKSVTVSEPCTATGPPTASFTYTSPARATFPVQFTDTSTGGPISWSWDFGDGMPPILPAQRSTAQNPTNTFANPGTYTVKLTATNCKGSTTTQQQVEVVGACDLTEPPPTPDFTWGPTGAYPDYPDQQQPFAGQPVTLTVADATTGSPTSWTWSSDAGSMTVHSPSFTFTWAESGDMNVTLTATNCFGTSAPVTKTVHVNDDIRPVVADFTWSPSGVTINAEVTFTAAQGMAYGNPDTFTWTFDDGSTKTGASVTYAFECGGSRRVTLTAARGSHTDTATKSVPVDGPTCGPESVMGVDAAKLQGLNDTVWRADVRVYNPSAFPTSITLQFLPVGKDNVDPFTVGPYQPPVPPRGTLVLDDILQWVKQNFGQDFSKTALRFTYRTDDDIPPIVTIRTYNLRPDGSKYGQINPGVNVVPGTTPSVQWVTGLRNNGVTEGFRTNYSIVNLRGEPGGIGGITFTLFDEAGTQLASKTFGLAPFGYIQDSIKALFGSAVENIGTFSLKVEVPTGGDVQVYASVMDNQTGDPVLIPATPPSDSPIYLPAMAHLSGEAGTVWRTDLQLTNPDANGPHTWEIRYTPKGTGLSVTTRTIALAANSSFYVDNVVSWVYDGTLAPDAQTSGIVRIAPADASSVYPAVAVRSYNLTATGTFGQGIAPLWAAKGVTAPDPTRLVLTGMSSEDIARTNFGFVNLSETQGANFVVYFYDERGNPLNPSGTDGHPKPYTYAIGPGTWDQDKLENRFKNAFKVSLPANLRAITAEIRVSDGGPGFAYATVIDNKTGDPNFIPAQLTP